MPPVVCDIEPVLFWVERIPLVPAHQQGGCHVADHRLLLTRQVEASGTFRMRLELPNPGNRIPAGIKCSVKFTP